MTNNITLARDTSSFNCASGVLIYILVLVLVPWNFRCIFNLLKSNLHFKYSLNGRAKGFYFVPPFPPHLFIWKWGPKSPPEALFERLERSITLSDSKRDTTSFSVRVLSILDHRIAHHRSLRVHFRRGLVWLHSCSAAIPVYQWQVQGRIITWRMVLSAQWPYESGHHPSSCDDITRWAFSYSSGMLLLCAPMCSVPPLTTYHSVCSSHPP